MRKLCWPVCRYPRSGTRPRASPRGTQARPSGAPDSGVTRANRAGVTRGGDQGRRSLASKGPVATAGREEGQVGALTA